MRAPTTLFSVFSVLALLAMYSCNRGPSAFDYGKDACHYCKMAIVDKPFACQAVTAKGKISKYDAIECLAAHLREEDFGEGYQVYVTDHQHPDQLLDGTVAYYVQSKAIPSPMGGNLSAYASKSEAEAALGSAEGSILDWSIVCTLE